MIPNIENSVPKIYVIHENEDWIVPLKTALKQQGLPYCLWFVDDNFVSLNKVPPQGIFFNRMSASSHTRGHRYAIELTETLITWLESHGRTVINGRNSLRLEASKSEQYLLLNNYGIRTPKTFVCNNLKFAAEIAIQFNDKAFLIKPNRGGKGTDIKKFNNIQELNHFIQFNNKIESPDGLILLQEYIKPANGNIIRLEFVGGRFLYALEVDATSGFELCPADVCQADNLFCPAGTENTGFKIIENYNDPFITIYEKFLKDNDIQVGAIEYLEDINGNRFVFDVNINTNYNKNAEKNAGIQYSGANSVTKYLAEQLNALKVQMYSKTPNL